MGGCAREREGEKEGESRRHTHRGYHLTEFQSVSGSVREIERHRGLREGGREKGRGDSGEEGEEGEREREGERGREGRLGRNCTTIPLSYH